MDVDARLSRIAEQPFRARFALRGRDRSIAELRGPAAIRRHAEQLIADRLAPAQPHKDGRQTPYRGHPVFVAQHATATCCRRCLARWHDIPAGEPLTPEQSAYVVDVLLGWIGQQLAA